MSLDPAFRWLNKQGVASSAGFELQRVHRFYYRYVRGDRALELMTEAKEGGDRVFLEAEPAWITVTGPIPLCVEDRIMVRNDLAAAFAFMRIKAIIQ